MSNIANVNMFKLQIGNSEKFKMSNIAVNGGLKEENTAVSNRT